MDQDAREPVTPPQLNLGSLQNQQQVDQLIDDVMGNVQLQLQQQSKVQPMVSEGTVQEMLDFLKQLAEKERNKKCGDPGTVVESSKDGSRFCTVCRKAEWEWEHTGD